MTPDRMAAIAARAYTHMRPWAEADFATALSRPTALLASTDHAFVLGQVVLDEAEILALATDPAHQRSGQAAQALTRFHAQAHARGALRSLLDVAADNAPAIAFYIAQGYAIDGRRKAYYRRRDGARGDALLMSRALDDAVSAGPAKTG